MWHELGLCLNWFAVYPSPLLNAWDVTKCLYQNSLKWLQIQHMLYIFKNSRCFPNFGSKCFIHFCCHYLNKVSKCDRVPDLGDFRNCSIFCISYICWTTYLTLCNAGYLTHRSCPSFLPSCLYNFPSTNVTSLMSYSRGLMNMWRSEDIMSNQELRPWNLSLNEAVSS
jgi:hypothetical protein